MNDDRSSEALRARVTDLEHQLESIRAELLQSKAQPTETHSIDGVQHVESHRPAAGGSSLLEVPSFGPSLHSLLLLSDSALPLGSFAYSNGLESFIAHHKPLPAGTTQISLFQRFLRLSIESLAHTNIPYVLAGFRRPSTLADLDNDLDASTLCKVARAASIAQGRALLSVWEKSFAPIAQLQFTESPEAITSIKTFSEELKKANLSPHLTGVNGHLASLWGVISLALGQNLAEVGYLYLLNHAKAVLSAAIRANVLGPYMAQSILAGHELQELIRRSLEKVWILPPEEAGQVVPLMDLWVGRHELLYSRIFNS